MADILHKGLDGADEELPLDDPNRPQHRHDDISQVADKGADGHDDPGEEVGFPAVAVQFFVKAVEGGDGVRLLGKDLDDVMAGVHLLDVAVEGPQGVRLALKELLGEAHHVHGGQQGEGEGEEGHPGENRADKQHHYQDGDKGKYRVDNLVDALLEGGGHRVHVVGDPAENIPDGAPVKVTQGQAADLLVHRLAQAIDGFLRHTGD